MNRPDLTTPLSSAEFSSLKAVKTQLLIPPQHQKRLKDLGLIDQKLGGWALTSAGELRIGMGK
jgi:hypothetical protein